MADLRAVQQAQSTLGIWLRALGMLTLVFALMIAGIVTQPRDDSAIRSFFTPRQGCAAPCFMGIRPGKTSSDQALAILRAQPWISQISSSDQMIQWTWNGQQPAFLSGDPADNEIELNDGMVDTIEIGTGMDMATIRLAFGEPDMWLSLNSMMMSSASSRGTFISLEQHALYDAYDIEVSTEGECPLAMNGQWTLITRISIPMQIEYTGFTPSLKAIPPLPKNCA